MSSVNAWVGSWRPHKPKGPIAAMYKSPGPTYILPGTTGQNNHDPRMLKSPAFSFGVRHRNLQTNCSPGPGHLVPPNITRVGRDGAPAYSVYSRCKDIQPFKTPGPGSYSPENATKTTHPSAPAFSLSARTKLFRNDQTPGPAAYMLPPVLGHNVVTKPAAPNIYFAGRSAVGSFHEDLRKTPGPGTYQVVDPSVYKHKAPQFSMNGRHFVPGDTTKKPGPGAHNLENVSFAKGHAPSFSFGIRHSEYITPLIVESTD